MFQATDTYGDAGYNDPRLTADGRIVFEYENAVTGPNGVASIPVSCDACTVNDATFLASGHNPAYTTVAITPPPSGGGGGGGGGGGDGGGGGGGGGAGGAVTDKTSPTLRVSGKATQKLGATIRMVVTAKTEDMWVRASGKVPVPVPGTARTFTLKATKERFVARGRKATLELKLTGKAKKAIKRTLLRKRKVSARIRITAHDAAGNATSRNRKISLKR